MTKQSEWPEEDPAAAAFRSALRRVANLLEACAVRAGDDEYGAALRGEAALVRNVIGGASDPPPVLPKKPQPGAGPVEYVEFLYFCVFEDVDLAARALNVVRIAAGENDVVH